MKRPRITTTQGILWPVAADKSHKEFQICFDNLKVKKLKYKIQGCILISINDFLAFLKPLITFNLKN